MSEAVHTAGHTPEHGPGRTPGPRLRLERERQGLSVQKAAEEMHLDTWVIDALETDTYTRLGPAVYAKGHLRKYAALLGLPAAEIVAAYESLQVGAPQLHTTKVRSLVPNSALQNIPWGRVAGILLLVLVLFGVAWWQPWEQRPAAASVKTVSAPIETPPPAAGLAEPVPPSPTQTLSDGVAPAVSASVAVPPAAPGAPTAAVAAPEATGTPSAVVPESGAGHARLRMSFSADSWVDVRDATGKRVFSGNGRANSVKSLAGEAPLRVYLGFASGVQLEINERTVAIGPQFVNGDVARFEAGADGVLRRDSHAARPRG
jgi:cytoskeleton protein RodZ